MASVGLRGVILAAALSAGVGNAFADEVKLNLATLAPPDSRVAQAIFHPWANRLNEAGQGVVHIETRDGFTLANFDNIYSRVMDDVVQVGWALQGAIGGKFVRSAIAGLPFVSEDCESASVAFWRLYKSGALDTEYADVVPLMLIVFPQSGIHLTRPVQTLEDLRGLKLIALGRVQSDVIVKLGGAPLSLPATDMYESLQRNTANGAVASWTTFDPFRLGEVTRYHVETTLGTSTGMLFMAKKKFDALPEAARKVLTENSGEGASRNFGAYLDKDAARVRDGVKTANDQILVAPTAERTTQWRSAVQPVTDGYVGGVPNGKAILDAYRGLLAQAKAK
jgi:TRAP-type transport system periplasmic protein